MIAFEIVTIGACATGIVGAAVAFMRGPRVLDGLGRQGQSWFDHSEDIAPSDLPSEDDRDAPIPKRPLRGRPD